MNPRLIWTRSALTAAITAVAVAIVVAVFQPATVETISVVSGFSRTAVTACENLAKTPLSNATITTAQVVPAGAFVPPDAEANADLKAFKKLPAFCRVAATLTPTPDSHIDIEVWLPASGWNGKLQAVGNGGFAGNIAYPALAEAVAAGYATASTDTGHKGNNGDFIPGHPEKLADFDHRAIHEMTVKAKTLIAANYGSPQKFAYFNGCSQGGRQALAEVQHYPADFDGLVEGDPVMYGMKLHAGRLAVNRFVNRSPDAAIPSSKYPAIHQAVLDACDAIDGVKDGVIENPTMCHFDPATIECKGADSPSCLTKPQVESARAMMSPVSDPTTGQLWWEGHLWPGGELMWATVGGPEPMGNIVTAFKNIIFKDPKWDYHTFNAARDLNRPEVKDNATLLQNNPRIGPFLQRGAKLLMYHGWNDQQITPQASTGYFNDLIKINGPDSVNKSVALFLVPGMYHCRGGPGTDTFDKMGALETWVEQGKKPTRIIASHLSAGKVERTRPLCPFGQVAKWNGTGSTDEAANFSCVAQKMEMNLQ